MSVRCGGGRALRVTSFGECSPCLAGNIPNGRFRACCGTPGAARVPSSSIWFETPSKEMPMRRFAIFALALALGRTACDDDNPTGPSNSGPIVFTAELRASNEVPAISNAESNAQGTATITFSVPRDALGKRHRRRHLERAGRRQRLDRRQRRSGWRTFTTARPVSNAGVFVDTRLTPANQIPTPGGAATINFEGVQIPRQPGAGRPEQPGRPLLQHALAAEPRRRRSAASWFGCSRQARRAPGFRLSGSRQNLRPLTRRSCQSLEPGA